MLSNHKVTHSGWATYKVSTHAWSGAMELGGEGWKSLSGGLTYPSYAIQHDSKHVLSRVPIYLR